MGHMGHMGHTGYMGHMGVKEKQEIQEEEGVFSAVVWGRRGKKIINNGVQGVQGVQGVIRTRVRGLVPCGYRGVKGLVPWGKRNSTVG